MSPPNFCSVRGAYLADGSDPDGNSWVDYSFASGTPHPRYRAFLRDTALSTRIDINDSWILKLEGHIMEGAALLYTQDNPDGLVGDWFLFAAKMTYSF